jgi:acyl-CoA thioesterase-1
MGDSLSAGFGIGQDESWVALLRKRLNDQGYGYTVVNASISGDTTTSGLRRLPRALETHRPAVVIIELGGNDGLRATPLATVRDNLDRMIRLSREAGAEVVLAGMQIPTNYGAGYTEGFARIYPELARNHDVSLVEFFLDGVALDQNLFLPDGIHPNAEAQPRLLDNVWPALEQALKRARQAGS